MPVEPQPQAPRLPVRAGSGGCQPGGGGGGGVGGCQRVGGASVVTGLAASASGDIGAPPAVGDCTMPKRSGVPVVVCCCGTTGAGGCAPRTMPNRSTSPK